MKRNTARILLIATPLVAFLLYAALNWFRIDESQESVGMGPEARRQPYLAYSRLLARMEPTARLPEGPSAIDHAPEKGMVMLGSRRLVYMTPLRVARLAAWVERGGTLVFEVEPAGIDDPLLDQFAIERDLPDPEIRPIKGRPPPRKPRKSSRAIFDWANSGETLLVNWGSSAVPLREKRLHAESTSAIADGEKVALAFASGEGRVVALGSLGFLQYARIGELDHAELGWQLAARGTPSGGALLFIRPSRAELGEWLLKEAWTVLIAAGLLLAIWLGRVVPRFGPLAPEPEPVRRRLAEHIAASGRFLWSRGEGAFLVAAARERVWHAISRRFRAGSLAPAGALDKIAESANASRAKAHRAFVAPVANEAALVDAAAALQEIESHFGRRRAPKLSRKGWK